MLVPRMLSCISCWQIFRTILSISGFEASKYGFMGFSPSRAEGHMPRRSLLRRYPDFPDMRAGDANPAVKAIVVQITVIIFLMIIILTTG